jgi:hypothetical protein
MRTPKRIPNRNGLEHVALLPALRAAAGFEKRGEVIRVVHTLRGGA